MRSVIASIIISWRSVIAVIAINHIMAVSDRCHRYQMAVNDRCRCSLSSIDQVIICMSSFKPFRLKPFRADGRLFVLISDAVMTSGGARCPRGCGPWDKEHNPYYRTQWCRLIIGRLIRTLRGKLISNGLNIEHAIGEPVRIRDGCSLTGSDMYRRDSSADVDKCRAARNVMERTCQT